ncbi:chromosomal replication initiator DnaA [Ancylobacter sp. Lp-2]|uniref:helix-turn-helix domain-containing protein n=1 Tax=Ancylobacter sp. Lp-2 TaxID=2881339 RepID=UPI001E60BE30|nr:helix-turn-helix domain-containing protein [Ancylobacter sp. Lp-2]MCB4768955.1 chromosomal replication initiator DnaA [Ancylobacter sp. Lp-2]
MAPLLPSLPTAGPMGHVSLLAARLAAENAGVPLHDLLQTRRGRRASASARALAMYLAHVGLGETMGRVARDFRRHRSTVAHACRQIEERREDRRCDDWIDGLERRLRRATEAGHGG